jgi:glycosyltransferase involved in cell wall biosynthesis
MKESEAMGLQNTISWTGLIKDPFGEGVFDAADIVCQLSRWEELFGWMIAEAMAYGKPVLATRVGGIPELVRDGETGLLVDGRDDHCRSQKLLTLCNSSELRCRFGQSGREITNRLFNLQRNVAQLIHLYLNTK